MADEQKPAGAPPADANVKAEFDRKLSNTESKLGELQKQNALIAERLAAVINVVNSSSRQPTPSTEEDVSELIHSDPKRAIEMIQAQAEERVMSKINKQTELNQRQAITVGELVNSYPELSSQDSDLTKKALEHYNALPQEERANPLSYKYAVTQAASELGLRPKAQRSSDDGFVMGGSNGSSPRPTREKDIPESVLATAKLFGVNVDDPAVKERIKKYSQYSTSDWMKYK
jgi:hypothetical protein